MMGFVVGRLIYNDDSDLKPISKQVHAIDSEDGAEAAAMPRPPGLSGPASGKLSADWTVPL